MATWRLMFGGGATPDGGAEGGAASEVEDAAAVWRALAGSLQLFDGPPPPPRHSGGPRPAFQLFFDDPKIRATLRVVFGDLDPIQLRATAWWIYRDLPENNKWALRGEVLEAQFQIDLWELNQWAASRR